MVNILGEVGNKTNTHCLWAYICQKTNNNDAKPTYMVSGSAHQHLHCVHSCVFQLHYEDSLLVLIRFQCSEDYQDEWVQYQQQMYRLQQLL